MKILNFKLSLVFSVLVTLFISVPSIASDSVNGNACMAANLNQAFDLKWDHARVENPASNTLTRFVTCTATSGPDIFNDSFQASVANSGAVTAYFSEGAATDAEVSCVFREMAANSTTVVATDMKIVTMTPAEEDTLPTTKLATFTEDDSIFVGLGSTLTVTCALPPGTGINQITVNKDITL